MFVRHWGLITIPIIRNWYQTCSQDNKLRRCVKWKIPFLPLREGSQLYSLSTESVPKLSSSPFWFIIAAWTRFSFLIPTTNLGKSRIKNIKIHSCLIYTKGDPDLGLQFKVLGYLVKYLVKVYLFTHGYKGISLFFFKSLCQDGIQENFWNFIIQAVDKDIGVVFKTKFFPSAYIPLHLRPYLIYPSTWMSKNMRLGETSSKGVCNGHC